MNDQQRAAMQMALDLLELDEKYPRRIRGSYPKEVITALREALAQPQDQGENNGQRNDHGNTKYSDDNSGNLCSNSDSEAPVKPQGEWVDLMDKEIQECWHGTTKQGWIGFVRAAIAKFKEKNTPSVVPGEPVAWSEFNEWMHKELPSGSVIGDPGWWASKIYRSFIQHTTPPVVPQGEPVAWMHTYPTGAEQINRTLPEMYTGNWTHKPLYTTPPSVEAMRIETLEKAANIADAELMNTNMLTSYPPKSSAAWNIVAAIRSLK